MKGVLLGNSWHFSILLTLNHSYWPEFAFLHNKLWNDSQRQWKHHCWRSDWTTDPHVRTCSYLSSIQHCAMNIKYIYIYIFIYRCRWLVYIVLEKSDNLYVVMFYFFLNTGLHNNCLFTFSLEFSLDWLRKPGLSSNDIISASKANLTRLTIFQQNRVEYVLTDGQSNTFTLHLHLWATWSLQSTWLWTLGGKWSK